jgi:hypothetical protein
MSFSGNFMCTSFKQQLLEGKHDFTAASGNIFHLALYTDAGAAWNAASDKYRLLNEVPATGSGALPYVLGGQPLVRSANRPSSSGTTALTSFDNITFTNATISARGALIYNRTLYNTGGITSVNAVCVLDFGSNKISTSGSFTVQFPTIDAANALIRIA